MQRCLSPYKMNKMYFTFYNVKTQLSPRVNVMMEKCLKHKVDAVVNRNPNTTQHNEILVCQGRRCVSCGLTFSNETLKPSILKWNIETKHPKRVGKPLEYFQRKHDGLQLQEQTATC